jgi:hypothetical protein
MDDRGIMKSLGCVGQPAQDPSVGEPNVGEPPSLSDQIWGILEKERNGEFLVDTTEPQIAASILQALDGYYVHMVSCGDRFELRFDAMRWAQNRISAGLSLLEGEYEESFKRTSATAYVAKRAVQYFYDSTKPI